MMIRVRYDEGVDILTIRWREEDYEENHEVVAGGLPRCV